MPVCLQFLRTSSATAVSHAGDRLYMALVQEVIDMFRIPSEIFTFEDLDDIPSDCEPSYEPSSDEHENPSDGESKVSEDSDDLYDSSDSEGCPDVEDCTMNSQLKLGEVSGLSNRHRNKSSLMLLASARSRAPKMKVRPPPKTEEEIALRELRIHRKKEKRELACFRQEVEDRMETYHTSVIHNPKMEHILQGDRNSTKAVVLAKANNPIFLRLTIAEVVEYADVLAAEIQRLDPGGWPARSTAARHCDQKSLFRRTRRSLDRIEQLCSEKNAKERARLKEEARARFRKDSMLDQ
ncbi:uncharacterized protein LTR77_009200 [Saxophila tyrrhenica]|uniref:Uncharacterized protein n=1 Tax=Saxophila tyrrhenica TaxID=1690608 RepID=A0AAV9NZ59_9PEZI|nr:hypothetical protein LTR77_009200 [Saxophila tyrrhenica]